MDWCCERTTMANTNQYMYNICPEGINYYDQNTDTNILVDWKFCALLGFSYTTKSNLGSIYKANVKYSEYISEKTKGVVKKFALEWSKILRDSFDILEYDCFKIRDWLVNNGVSYSFSECVLPSFLNEVTDRNCIFAIIKAVVLQTIDSETEQFWLSDNKLKVKFDFKALADSVIDFSKYAGLLPESYTPGQDYNTEGYYVVFEDDSSLEKENICEWLLDQDEGFFADVSSINPRGKPAPIEPPDNPDKLDVSGYSIAEPVPPPGMAPEDFHFVYPYSGVDISFPSVVVASNAAPPENEVQIWYRRADDNVWHLTPPTIREFGNYLEVVKIVPQGTAVLDYKTKFLTLGLGVKRRKVIVSGDSRTVTKTDDKQTLLSVTSSTVPGDLFSGLAAGDYIKPGFQFKQSYENVGIYQIEIDKESFDILHDVDGVAQSRKDNYEIEFLPGTLTIEPAVPVVDIPQEDFGFKGRESGTKQWIADGDVAYYNICLRPVDFEHSCIVNGVKFYVDDCEEAIRHVSVWFLPDGEFEPSSQYCVFDGQINVSNGENVVNFTTAKALTTYECYNFAFFIDNYTNESLVLNTWLYQKSNYGTNVHYESSSYDSVEDIDFDNLQELTVPPLFNFVRNIQTSDARTSTFIDGFYHNESNIIPVPGTIGQANNLMPAGVFALFVSKTDFGYKGDNLLGIRLRISNFVNNNTLYPTTVTVKYYKKWDNSWDATSVGLTSEEFGFGSVEITDEPEDWIFIPYDKDSYGSFVIEELCVGLVFRIECSSGLINVSNVLFQEDDDNKLSAYSVGFISDGFSLSTNDAQIQRLGQKPVCSFEWGDSLDSASQPVEQRREVACWITETYGSDTGEFGSIQGNGFKIHPVELVEINGDKWFKVEQGTPCWLDYEGDFNLGNVRKYTLSFCAFADVDNSNLGLMTAISSVNINLGNSSTNNVYKMCSVALEATQDGTDYEILFSSLNSGAYYLKDIVLVVDFQE